MLLSDILIIVNILATIYVGYILHKRVKSQKELLQSYKDHLSVLDPKKSLFLKEQEIKQMSKLNNLNKDITTKQMSELIFYMEHILNHFEDEAKSIGEEQLFKKETIIRNNMPSCLNLFNLH
jgi:transcriptional regulator with PAS, ATPase and Fis domain